MDAGFIKRGDPEQVSLTLWAHGHGLVSIYHRGLLPVDTEPEFRDVMTRSFQWLVRGIGTEAYGDLMAETATGESTSEATEPSGTAVS